MTAPVAAAGRAAAPATGLGGAIEQTPARRRKRSRPSSGHVVLLVAGLLGAIFTFAALNAAKGTVSVAVATQTLEPGSPIDAGAVNFTDVNVDDAVLDDLIRADDLAALEGDVVTIRVPEGALLTRDFLKPPTAAESDLRAMSIAVDPSHAAGGAIEAGDRVDVIGPAGGGAGFIAESLEVLAVGDGGGGITDGPQSFAITVAVNPETAVALANAMSGEGNIEILRSTGAAPIEGG